MPEQRPVDLWRFIRATYNMEELEGLCFQLGVPFEDLQGETREAKARELVEYLERNDRLDDLVAVLKEERAERFQLTFGAAQITAPDDDRAIVAAGRARINPRILSVLALLVLTVLLIWFVTSLRGRGTRGEPTPPGATASGDESRTINTPAGDAIEQVYVPAGKFMMGSEEGSEDEQPVHTVSISAFWLDRKEVTNEQFAAFAQDADYETAAEDEGGGFLFDGQWSYTDGADWRHPSGPDSDLVGLEDHPVVLVSWVDAVEYCQWVGGRLPTEAEWEYAARGPDGLIYPWGNAFDGENLNYCDSKCPFAWADEMFDDSYEFTGSVDSYPEGRSWVGAADLAGNVWEWVADWYGADFYKNTVTEDPTGPSQGVSRVLRGGGWSGDESLSRSYVRSADVAPNDRTNFVGFRCAAD